MINNEKYVLVFGASIVDIIGFTKKKYWSKDSIPGTIKVSLGGVCRNIAENLGRVGVNTEFITTVGTDNNGRSIIDNAKKIGYKIDNSLILENMSTATYMAILNEHGEMESAIVDMDSLDAMDKAFIDCKREVFENAEYTIVGADNPEQLEYILKEYSHKSKFILDPVSASKAEKINHLVKYFHTVKPNRLEAAALCGFKIETNEDLSKAGRYLIDKGVENVFISLDADGIYYLTKSGEEGMLACCDEVDVKNVTGAGDSFVAGLGYGYMNNLSIIETLKYAIAMSIITISHEDTINPNMNYGCVKEYIETIKWSK